MILQIVCDRSYTHIEFSLSIGKVIQEFFITPISLHVKKNLGYDDYSEDCFLVWCFMVLSIGRFYLLIETVVRK